MKQEEYIKTNHYTFCKYCNKSIFIKEHFDLKKFYLCNNCFKKSYYKNIILKFFNWLFGLNMP